MSAVKKALEIGHDFGGGAASMAGGTDTHSVVGLLRCPVSLILRLGVAGMAAVGPGKGREEAG